MDSISGSIEKIKFINQDNGFTIANILIRNESLVDSSESQILSIRGTMPTIQIGEIIICQGEFVDHPKFGRQFEVKSFTVEMPTDLTGIRKYLAATLDKVGPATARKITDKFGEQTFDIIEKNPERLLEIKGLGTLDIAKLKEAWQKNQNFRRVMMFMHPLIGTELSNKICNHFGENSLELIKENPYCLTDVGGINFHRADIVAQQKLNIPLDAPIRLDACIKNVLNALADECGHTYSPQNNLLRVVSKNLDQPVELLAQRLPIMQENKIIKIQDNKIWRTPLFAAESGIADKIRELQSESRLSHIPLSDLSIVEQKIAPDFKLSADQREAIQLVLQNKVSIICGGPGSGKSTIISILVQLLLMNDIIKQYNACDKLQADLPVSDANAFIVTPTGRAASRINSMLNSIGFGASTIHRILGLHRGSVMKCNILIIDEMSMVDTILMHDLLRIVPQNAHLIMVGDYNQLPSIGPGRVFEDMIKCEKIATYQLKKIHRQGEDSLILTNAYNLIDGIPLVLENPFSDVSDFIFIEMNNQSLIVDEIINQFHPKILESRGIIVQDYQVIMPMKKGNIGCGYLNEKLQEMLNPLDTSDPNEFQTSEGLLRVKDRVIQSKNNYTLGVYNGDMGYITEIGKDDHKPYVVVKFAQSSTTYTGEQIFELRLAYAITIHKAQGSEFPVVIMPIHVTHSRMLNRNLLYTALTRGKKLYILIGQKSAIDMARERLPTQRYTGLRQMLAG